MYRFGGQYLDLDTIMLKNISNIGVNFAGAETHDSVANAVMNLDPHTEIGHKLGELFLMYEILWQFKITLLITYKF